MVTRRQFLVAAIGAAALGMLGSSATLAGDCFRQLGLGYSAGYHAPAPFAQSATCAKVPGYLGWKSACCQPGGVSAGCGCGPVAPACGSCWSLPRLSGSPCGMPPCGCGTGCFPRPSPGIY